MRPKERNRLANAKEAWQNKADQLTAIAKDAYKYMTYDERKKLGLIKKT